MSPSHAHRTAQTLVAGALALAAGAVPLLLPGSAEAGSSVVTDGFDRSVRSGWGAPSTGGAWSSVGGSATSVGGSEGTVTGIQGGRSFRAHQPAVSVADVDVRAELTLPVGKSFQYSVESRRQRDGSSYSSRVRLDATGKVHLDLLRSKAGALTLLKEATLDLKAATGSRVAVELSTTAAAPVVVQGKVYRVGQTEPGWQLTALDSAAGALTRAGSTGVMAYNGAGNPTVTLRTQTFAATRVSPGSGVVTGPAPSTSSAKGLAVSHGAGAVGSARYPAPADALFVAPSGSDANPGTRAEPYKTLAKALTRNRSGQTIVLRAGTYHESVVVAPGHAATIQPYPGEKVWFDGTRTVKGFTASGGAHVARWTVKLDASPTYTKGAPDGKATGWQFVNPARPMAAHPDMVWIGSTEQKQVKSRSLVKAGTFYVDTAKGKLYLGSNPAGKTVRSADLQSAFSLRAPGTVLRGFGIRRYAPSVWQQGAVTSYYERMTLDNLTVLDSATSGIGFYKPGSTIKNTTVAGSGQIGIQASYADGLVLDDVSLRDNNDEGFNPAPSAGGIKITTTRGVTLRNSELLRTNGNQFWTDQSTYDVTLTGNEILKGSRWGVVLEISSLATVTDNIIAGNAHDGIMVQNTDKVKIWNNTIVGNRRAIAVVQDSRRIQQLGVSGHDKRRAQPDLSMPWVIGNSSVGNNVLSAGKGATAVLAVEAYELTMDAGRLGIAVNGNVYAQTALGTPKAAVTWARKGAQPHQFVLLEDYRGTTGQEQDGLHALLPAPVDAAYRPASTITARTAAVAQPLPADVAERAGRAAGTRQLGAWSRPTA